MKKFVFISLLCGLSCSVYAENMALIMGVSKYQYSPLSGVYKDLENARKFAIAMNIPEKNIYEFKDEQLTLNGLKNKLEEFSNSVNSGDRIFIYFSGHGTNTDNGRGCDQGIVAQDMQVLYRKDFQVYLDKITETATKTLVFLDTCFSGGIVKQARSIGFIPESGKLVNRILDNDGFPKAKFLDMKATNGTQSCRADNVESARGFRDLALIADETPNYYFLGAASANEAAIDGGASIGGWATNALLSCIEEADQQQVKSGILTMSDAKLCAQSKINQLIKSRKQNNQNFPFSAMTLTVGSGEGSGSMPVGFTFTKPDTANQRVESVELFENILQNSDQNKKLNITTAKPRVKINQDNLELNIESPVEGYLTIFVAGSSKKIYQIFPDNIDDDNYIQAGNTITLPKKIGHYYPSLGPEGKNTILAVVSPTRNRFAMLGLPTVNIRYPMIENTALNAKNIVLSVLNPTSNCTRTRDFGSIAKQSSECSTSYSAGKLEIHEFN